MFPCVWKRCGRHASLACMRLVKKETSGKDHKRKTFSFASCTVFSAVAHYILGLIVALNFEMNKSHKGSKKTKREVVKKNERKGIQGLARHGLKARHGSACQDSPTLYNIRQTVKTLRELIVVTYPWFSLLSCQTKDARSRVNFLQRVRV